MKISKILYFLNFIIFINLLSPCFSSYNENSAGKKKSSLRRIENLSFMDNNSSCSEDPLEGPSDMLSRQSGDYEYCESPSTSGRSSPSAESDLSSRQSSCYTYGESPSTSGRSSPSAESDLSSRQSGNYEYCESPSTSGRSSPSAESDLSSRQSDNYEYCESPSTSGRSSPTVRSELSSRCSIPGVDIGERAFISKGNKHFKYPKCKIRRNLKVFEVFMVKKLRKQYEETEEKSRLFIRDPDYIRGKIIHSASKYGITLEEWEVQTLVKRLYLKLITK